MAWACAGIVLRGGAQNREATTGQAAEGALPPALRPEIALLAAKARAPHWCCCSTGCHNWDDQRWPSRHRHLSHTVAGRLAVGSAGAQHAPSGTAQPK
jgi:hypothetical protein